MARVRGRGRRDLKSEINIVPLLDVLLVLLLIFMATAPIITQSVEVDLPDATEANPKTVFLIGGAKDVPYDEIIKALNLLHQAGVKSVGLMTQPI